MEKIGEEIINLDELKTEMMVELSRCNIHLLREQGNRLGVRSPTRHKKNKLVELIVEKKLETHRPAEGTFSEYKSLISPADREMLMNLFCKSDEVEGDMISGAIEFCEGMDGFLRMHDNRISDEDVFVPQGVINECKIKFGDRVIGKAVKLRGQNFRGMVSVISVNGHRRKAAIRKDFSEFIARDPETKIRLDRSKDNILRLMNIFSPLAKGQRSMIFSKGLMNQAGLLCGLVRILKESGVRTSVLLLSEKPETVAYYKSLFSDSVIATSCEADDKENKRVAKFVLEQQKREAELGKDTALIIGNMAALYSGSQAKDGKDFDFRTLFGAGRQLDNGGSLTVVGFSFLSGTIGEFLYETLAPLSNSVAMLKPDGFMSDKPAYDIFESFTDFVDCDEHAVLALKTIKTQIKENKRNFTDDEILELYTKIQKQTESK